MSICSRFGASRVRIAAAIGRPSFAESSMYDTTVYTSAFRMVFSRKPAPVATSVTGPAGVSTTTVSGYSTPDFGSTSASADPDTSAVRTTR